VLQNSLGEPCVLFPYHHITLQGVFIQWTIFDIVNNSDKQLEIWPAASDSYF